MVDLNPLSATYGQITGITISNPGTGYTSLPTVILAGGSPAQAATITGGTAATLVLQRINVTDAGVSSSYTTTPTVTLTGGGATTQGTATATIGGTAGYLLSGGTTILGGITGNLRTIASSLNGTITDGSGFSVEGTSTFGSRSGAINLDSTANNLLGTITVGSNAGVTINNAVGSILGNFTGANASGVPDTSAALGGALTLGSKGSIYQGTAGALMNVTDNATFLATSTALGGGTPNGSVIINNANNSFTGSVAATGTLVVIRDSNGNFNLGNMITTTSLTLTAVAGDILQGVGTTIGTAANPTGAATFAVPNGGNISVGNANNVFGSTVGFNALSGTLGNITIRDTGDLTLPVLSTAGSLAAQVDNGTMTLANFTTSAGSATYTGTTSLAAATTITTTTGTTFNGTLNGAQNLTLNAGAGNVAFNGAVGGTTRLGTITIGSAAAITANAITAASLQIPAGANATTLNFNGAQNYNTGAGLNAVANIINLNSSVTTTEGGIVTLNADTGLLTIAAAGDIVSAGAVNLTGAGGISTGGDIITRGALVTFNNAVTQTGAVTIDTTNAGSNSAGALVTFAGAVTGNQNLTLRVGTGNNITVPGAATWEH